MYINFYDVEENFGKIETEVDPKIIKKLLDEYKKDNDSYNWEDFILLLKKKGIKFKYIPEGGDVVMYF